MLIDRTMRYAATVWLLFCVLPDARADENQRADEPPRLTLGATMGMSLATQETAMPFGTDLDAGSKIGLAFGLGANLNIHRNLSSPSGFFLAVRPEIGYVAKGTNLEIDDEKVGAYHLSYIEIPLLARAGFRIAPTLAPYLLIGPEMGILLTAKFENSRGELDDSREGLKSTDFGLVVGGGMALDIAAIKGAMSLEARYDLGITDINDTGMGGFVKNRTIFLLLGYQYGAL